MKLMRDLCFIAALALPASALSQAIPNPVLSFRGSEPYEAGGKQFIRYRFEVANLERYPEALFMPAPDLPPCGSNANSARTWVDFYDQRGKRLYGFCALRKPADLHELWFPVEEGLVPPSWVYIEMIDRKTSIKYKSNLAETTL